MGIAGHQHHGEVADLPDGGPGPEWQADARRVAIARRLLARGVRPRTLEALLPGWEAEIRLARVGVDDVA